MGANAKKFPNKLIGEILVEEGFLEPEKLKKGLEIQKKEGGLIGEILVRLGWVTEEELVSGLAKQLSLPFIHLGNYNVNRTAVKSIPKELAERHLLFPFEQDEMSLSLAMANPLDSVGLEQVSKSTSLILYIFLAPAQEIRKAIRDHYAESLASREAK